MPVPVEERLSSFQKFAEETIKEFQIEKSKDSEYVDAQRIGYLFGNIMVKIYNAYVGQDALMCFRDWSLKFGVRCNQIDEVELRSGKKVSNAYFNPSIRVDERLSFDTYIRILEDLLSPKRTPLTERTPVTSMEFFAAYGEST